MKHLEKLIVMLTVLALPLSIVGCGVNDEETFTVTYKTDYGTAPNQITVTEGTVLTAEQLPTLTYTTYSYVFQGWFDGETEAVAGSYTVTSDVTLTASWNHEIILDWNGETGSSNVIEIPIYNARVTIPTISSKGKIFVCWNSARDGTGISVRGGENDVDAYHLAKINCLYAIWRDASENLKVASHHNLENVLASIKDGDTLIFLGGTPATSWSERTTELTAKYLTDSEKKITLDVSYCPAASLGPSDRFTQISAPFRGCTSIYKVIYSNSDIYEDAFSNCTNLSEIVFPDTTTGITKIGEGAFKYCLSLNSITIPDSVTEIEEDAFYHSRALSSITIPKNVTSIEKRAFYGCSNLTSVTFKNTEDWYSYTHSFYSDGETQIDVTSPETNATNLKEGDWSSKYLRQKSTSE